jgi:hypothetical protein
LFNFEDEVHFHFCAVSIHSFLFSNYSLIFRRCLTCSKSIIPSRNVNLVDFVSNGYHGNPNLGTKFFHRLTRPDVLYLTVKTAGLYHLSLKSYNQSYRTHRFQKTVIVRCFILQKIFNFLNSLYVSFF